MLIESQRHSLSSVDGICPLLNFYNAMPRSRKRLCDRAFLLLDEEVKRLCSSNPMGQVNRGLVLQRLERLRQREGTPAGYSELRSAVEDVFPNFDDRVLKRAARLNQPNGVSQAAQWVIGLTVGAGTLAGGLWLVNLPYPMIRWPVARVAPMLLLPSFMRMDHDYRQAIIHVEQADQLINAATSAADFELGAETAAQAQKHLDRLPVWFLGYYPQRYCSWFSCGWRFTLDEFESARALIGRMDAQIFQEQNALDTLDEASLAVETARRRYEAVQTLEEKALILANWQEGMDRLAEIPPETLAGQTTQTRLQAFRRDYEALVGSSADVSQASTLVKVAQEFASKASQEGQNPPHTAETWGRIAGLWESALAQLEQVPANSAGYADAQKLKAEYQNSLGIIRERQITEQKAVQAFAAAQASSRQVIANNSATNLSAQVAELQSIIDQLRSIPSGTTVSAEAAVLLKDVEGRDWRLRQQLKSEL